MLANAEPFSSRESFFAAGVWPLKNTIQLAMMSDATLECTAGVVVVVVVTAAVAVGIVLESMLALGGADDPHAASRIDATAIPEDASPIREPTLRAAL